MSVDPSPEVPENHRSKTFLHAFKIIVQDGHTFYVNAKYLAFFSPIFEELFFGDYTEAPNQEVQLPDENVNSFSILLTLLTQGMGYLMARTFVELKDLMRLADKFTMKVIHAYCLCCINGRIAHANISVEDLASFLGLVLDYGNTTYNEAKWDIIDRLTAQTIETLVDIKLWEKVKNPMLNNAMLKLAISNCDPRFTTLHVMTQAGLLSACTVTSCDQETDWLCEKCRRPICEYHNEDRNNEKCSGEHVNQKLDRTLVEFGF